ncbi:MAG: NAD-dependent epimerase/dehydratase family protein [Bryobacterales bacterium]|nr:NAD-dependent epimerase/dehydratase family protein [Bryobacterales bacterium]
MSPGEITLVTGAAGFIGFHLSLRLLREGVRVVAVDNLNSYYDPQLKLDRLALLSPHPHFKFHELDLADRQGVQRLVASAGAGLAIHLAGQAGVRYSVTNPFAFVDSNLVGFANVLESCRQTGVRHFLYASSSSVYGAHLGPFATTLPADSPLSLYAATKRANELMAYSYAHLFGLPVTGLRFFTVYGPWGRPDMAPALFADAILNERPINLYNHGQMRRDFTFIDDVVEAVARIRARPPSGSPPAAIYNVGNSEPVHLLTFVETLEACLGRSAKKNFLPMQPGDVVETSADVSALERDFQFKPATPLESGLRAFAGWYRTYYRLVPAAPVAGAV